MFTTEMLDNVTVIFVFTLVLGFIFTAVYLGIRLVITLAYYTNGNSMRDAWKCAGRDMT